MSEQIGFTIPGTNRPRRGTIIAKIPKGHIPPAVICENFEKYRLAFSWHKGMTSVRSQDSYLIETEPERPKKRRALLWWVNESDTTPVK